MKDDGVDCVDVGAVAVAFKSEVLGLQAVLHMVHRHSALD